MASLFTTLDREVLACLIYNPPGGGAKDYTSQLTYQ